MGYYLNKAVSLTARIHSKIMEINDGRAIPLTDKQLHFLVIGMLGMVLIVFVYPVFRFLARKKWYMILSWIYVFTLIIVITFAIEIGQKVSGTGAMEFADIVYGVVGFMAFFIAFIIIIGVIKFILYIRKKISRSLKRGKGRR